MVSSQQELRCSFCGKPESKVKKLLEGGGCYICDECILFGVSYISDEQPIKTESLPKPITVKNYLDNYVISQDKAKKIISVAVYNHFKRLSRVGQPNPNVELQKSNIMLIGSSGSGKTLLAQTLARILKVPFTIADATSLTEAGYVGCLDRDTEYLSEEGWKPIGDYKEGKIAQYNPETGQAEFVYPLHYTKKTCDYLTKFKTKYGLSQILSDKHNVVYIGSRGNINQIKFSELKTRYKTNKSGFRGKFITTFKAPNTEGLTFTEDELRLQVAAIADGYYPNKNTNFCRFTFKKKRKVDRLLNILKRLNKKYTFNNRLSNNRIQIDCTTKTSDKKFTSEYFKGNKNQLETIADECLHWDGNCKNQFYSSSEKSSDFIQYCFTITGKNSSILKRKRKDKPEHYLPEYKVHKYKRKYVSAAHSKNMKLYKTIDGFKYCFTVPTGMFIARNNKCIFVTGNSDVESIFQPLLSTHSVEEVEKAIIYIDEIDKKARKSSSNPSLTRDVSGESVQYALLKLLEGSVIDIPNVGKRKHPNEHCTRLNTSNILFILGGAFNGLADIIAERQAKNTLGFLSEKNTVDKQQRENMLLQEVTHKDLITFGIIPELAGRIPVLVSLEELNINDLCKILVEPKNSLVKQYQELLAMDNVELVFEKVALKEIAFKANKMGTGARGLRSIMEDLMIDIMYEIPSENVKKCVVTKECITKRKKPKKILNEKKSKN